MSSSSISSSRSQGISVNVAVHAEAGVVDQHVDLEAERAARAS